MELGNGMNRQPPNPQHQMQSPMRRKKGARMSSYSYHSPVSSRIHQVASDSVSWHGETLPSRSPVVRQPGDRLPSVFASEMENDDNEFEPAFSYSSVSPIRLSSASPKGVASPFWSPAKASSWSSTRGVDQPLRSPQHRLSPRKDPKMGFLQAQQNETAHAVINSPRMDRQPASPSIVAGESPVLWPPVQSRGLDSATPVGLIPSIPFTSSDSIEEPESSAPPPPTAPTTPAPAAQSPRSRRGGKKDGSTKKLRVKFQNPLASYSDSDTEQTVKTKTPRLSETMRQQRSASTRSNKSTTEPQSSRIRSQRTTEDQDMSSGRFNSNRRTRVRSRRRETKSVGAGMDSVAAATLIQACIRRTLQRQKVEWFWDCKRKEKQLQQRLKDIESETETEVAIVWDEAGQRKANILVEVAQQLELQRKERIQLKKENSSLHARNEHLEEGCRSFRSNARKIEISTAARAEYSKELQVHCDRLVQENRELKRLKLKYKAEERRLEDDFALMTEQAYAEHRIKFFCQRTIDTALLNVGQSNDAELLRELSVILDGIETTPSGEGVQELASFEIPPPEIEHLRQSTASSLERHDEIIMSMPILREEEPDNSGENHNDESSHDDDDDDRLSEPGLVGYVASSSDSSLCFDVDDETSIESDIVSEPSDG